MFHLLNPNTINDAGEKVGFEFTAMIRGINSCDFTTSVYDHLFSDEEEIKERQSHFALIDGYTVSSGKLQEIYSSMPGIPPPDIVIPDGVDTEHFSPAGNRSDEHQFFPQVGWATAPGADSHRVLT